MRNSRGLAFLQPIPAYLQDTSQCQRPAGSRRVHVCHFLFCSPLLNCTCPTVHFPLSFPLLPPLFQFTDVGAAVPARAEASTQTELQMVDTALQVTGCGECLEPLPEAMRDGRLSCRRCAVLQELCHQVEELWQEVSRLCSIREDERQTGSSQRHSTFKSPGL